jgi:hypothetical protein
MIAQHKQQCNIAILHCTRIYWTLSNPEFCHYLISYPVLLLSTLQLIPCSWVHLKKLTVTQLASQQILHPSYNSRSLPSSQKPANRKYPCDIINLKSPEQSGCFTVVHIVHFIQMIAQKQPKNGLWILHAIIPWNTHTARKAGCRW